MYDTTFDLINNGEKYFVIWKKTQTLPFANTM